VDSIKKLSDFNLAHVARKIYEKKKPKQTNKRHSAHPVQYRFKIEGSLEGMRMTMEDRICERDEF